MRWEELRGECSRGRAKRGGGGCEWKRRGWEPPLGFADCASYIVGTIAGTLMEVLCGPMARYGADLVGRTPGGSATRMRCESALQVGVARNADLLLGVGDGEQNARLRDELAVDVRFAGAFADAAFEAIYDQFHIEPIPRPHLPAEPRIVDPGQQWPLTLKIRLRQDGDAAELRHGFDDEHPRHDAVFRIVPRKVRLIGRHQFISFHADAWLQFGDAIHQQERVSVRQDCPDFLHIHRKLETHVQSPFNSIGAMADAGIDRRRRGGLGARCARAGTRLAPDARATRRPEPVRGAWAAAMDQ